MTRPKSNFPPKTSPPSQAHSSPDLKKRKHDSHEPNPSQSNTPSGKKPKQYHNQPSQSQPIVPFTPHTKILLIGEGDFSFATSLVRHHGCASICATSYDPDLPSLLRKYPHAEANLAEIEEAFAHEPDGGKWRVRFGVDGTKLHAYKDLGRRGRGKGGWDIVWWNFPHCGGRSRDVNRQVRFNQEMLSLFFASAKGVLRTPEDEEEGVGYGDDEREGEEGSGRIIVTLFEGEPYSLWNVRDLARNKGLVARRSWRFDGGVYPGYRHARTIGVIKKGGEMGEEESETAWRGEERSARTYEFGLKGEESGARNGIVNGMGRTTKKQEKGEESDSE